MTTLPHSDAGNLLAHLDATAADELTTRLLRRGDVAIERIVSTGQSSPPGFWYDQAHDEWVLLIAGAATLEIDGGETRRLRPGDYVFLPAHCRHRVAETAAGEPTVWLAVHIGIDRD